MIILKRRLNKRDGKKYAASGLGQGHVSGCCEHGNEPSDSIRCEKILDQLLKYDYVPWSQAFYNATCLVSGYRKLLGTKWNYACVRKCLVP
jgi:hypothetical protein